MLSGQVILVSLLLTLIGFRHSSGVSIVDFGQLSMGATSSELKTRLSKAFTILPPLGNL